MAPATRDWLAFRTSAHRQRARQGWEAAQAATRAHKAERVALAGAAVPPVPQARPGGTLVRPAAAAQEDRPGAPAERAAQAGTPVTREPAARATAAPLVQAVRRTAGPAATHKP